MIINHCPFCKQYGADAIKDGLIWRVVCDKEGCHTEGPVALSENEAIEKWNKAVRRKNDL